KLSGLAITGSEGVSEVASASQLSIYSLDGVIGMCLSRRDGKEHRVELNLTKDQASFLGKSLIALADNVEVDDKPDGLREGGCALFEGKKCKIKALSRSDAQIV